MWDRDQYQRFVKCLMQAHQWETHCNPLMSTIIGRHIYLCIVCELKRNGQIDSSKSLKKIFSHPTLTDRAIRLKLRELEHSGYVVTELSTRDGRSRTLKLTQKFLDLMDEHNDVLANSYKNKILVLGTNFNPELLEAGYKSGVGRKS